MIKLSPKQVEFLNKQIAGRVATASSKGELHVVPVCYVFYNGNIYFATDYGAKKVRNLKENRKISIIIDQYFEDWSKLKGILIQGEAELLDKGPEFAKIRDLLYKKYPQYLEMPIKEEECLIVKIKPSRVSRWGFK